MFAGVYVVHGRDIAEGNLLKEFLVNEGHISGEKVSVAGTVGRAMGVQGQVYPPGDMCGKMPNDLETNLTDFCNFSKTIHFPLK